LNETNGVKVALLILRKIFYKISLLAKTSWKYRVRVSKKYQVSVSPQSRELYVGQKRGNYKRGNYNSFRFSYFSAIRKYI